MTQYPLEERLLPEETENRSVLQANHRDNTKFLQVLDTLLRL